MKDLRELIEGPLPNSVLDQISPGQMHGAMQVHPFRLVWVDDPRFAERISGQAQPGHYREHVTFDFLEAALPLNYGPETFLHLAQFALRQHEPRFIVAGAVLWIGKAATASWDWERWWIACVDGRPDRCHLAPISAPRTPASRLHQERAN